MTTAFLSAHEVLAYIPEFPLSLSTLMRMTERGDFPAAAKVGGRNFWEPAAIDAWKAERIQEARSRSVKSQPKE